MAFNEALADRIRQRLARRKNVEERKMFGGIGFLLNGNMLVGVWKDSLIVRPQQPCSADPYAPLRQIDAAARAGRDHLSFLNRRSCRRSLHEQLRCVESP